MRNIRLWFFYHLKIRFNDYDSFAFSYLGPHTKSDGVTDKNFVTSLKAWLVTIQIKTLCDVIYERPSNTSVVISDIFVDVAKELECDVMLDRKQDWSETRIKNTVACLCSTQGEKVRTLGSNCFPFLSTVVPNPWDSKVVCTFFDLVLEVNVSRIELKWKLTRACHEKGR